MRPPRPPVAVLVLLVVVFVLGGCGGSSDPSDDGGGSAPGSADAPDDSSDPTDESSSETEGAATGPLVEMPSVTLHVPEGWQTREVSSEQTAASPASAGTLPVISLYVRDFELDTGGEQRSLDEAARDEIDAGGEDRDPKIESETEIAGVPVFHLAGPVTSSLYLETFGPSVADRGVAISFEFLASVREARREKVIDEVLASVEWTF